jgi:nitrite reductase/ring-hydroxylating ferredoxin subunit
MDRRHRRGRDRRVTATRLVDLMGVDEVPEGTMKMAHVDGTDQVIVVHTGGEIRAFQGICTHEYFELDKGFLTGGGSSGPNGKPAGTLTCALHLSRFDLANGEPLDPPAELPLAQYPVVVRDGRVLIEIPEGPLPVNE